MHNTEHTKHHNTTRAQKKHSTNTALHNINNTVATCFNQPIPPTRTSIRHEQSIRHSKHTHTLTYHILYHILYSDTSQTTSKDAWHTQHSGTTHLQNSNSNQEFHKVASFHPYSSTSTLQTSLCHQTQYN